MENHSVASHHPICLCDRLKPRNSSLFSSLQIKKNLNFRYSGIYKGICTCCREKTRGSEVIQHDLLVNRVEIEGKENKIIH